MWFSICLSQFHIDTSFNLQPSFNINYILWHLCWIFGIWNFDFKLEAVWRLNKKINRFPTYNFTPMQCQCWNCNNSNPENKHFSSFPLLLLKNVKQNSNDISEFSNLLLFTVKQYFIVTFKSQHCMTFWFWVKFMLSAKICTTNKQCQINFLV